MKTDLITREGYDMLYKELNYLWKERRPEITEKVGQVFNELIQHQT